MKHEIPLAAECVGTGEPCCTDGLFLSKESKLQAPVNCPTTTAKY